jgi:hypothetical protein
MQERIQHVAELATSACSFGWWLMAGAGLFWEKSTVGWLLMTGLLWEKSTAGWWLISQTNRAQIAGKLPIKWTKRTGRRTATKRTSLVVFPHSNRLFGCGTCGLGWLQPSFWGWLQPTLCLVVRWLKRLEPTCHLFGWMHWVGTYDLITFPLKWWSYPLQ